jgi:hypothetical protein
MDSGLAFASLRRRGMTRLTKVDTLAPNVLTQAGLELAPILMAVISVRAMAAMGADAG